MACFSMRFFLPTNVFKALALALVLRNRIELAFQQLEVRVGRVFGRIRGRLPGRALLNSSIVIR